MFIVFCTETMGGYASSVEACGLACPWIEDIDEWSLTDDPAICERGDIDQYVPEPHWPLWSP